MSNERFIVRSDGRNYRIHDKQGNMKYGLIFNNRHDAHMHCQYLNQQYTELTKTCEENKQYRGCLLKIKGIVEQIHIETGEIHILTLAIQIKELIKEVLK